MTAPILFDDAIHAAITAIATAGVDLTGCEMTLLRDLRGRLRLHVVAVLIAAQVDRVIVVLHVGVLLDHLLPARRRRPREPRCPHRASSPTLAT